MRVTIEQIRDEISDRLEAVGVWITSRTKPRSRLIGTTVIVLGLHAMFFWVLVASKTEGMRLKEFKEEIYPVELWKVPPKPEEIPEPLPKPVPEEVVVEEVETVTPPEVEPEPQPQPQPQPQPVTQPQPSPAESPRRSLTVKPVDMPDLARKQQPTVRTQTQREVSVNNAPAPTAAAEPARNLGVKKRNEDDRISARTQDTARNDPSARDVSTLNLHQPDKVAPDAPASGLAAARKPAGGGGGGGGTPASGWPPGNLQGLTGGRSGVSQAIQNHNSCVALQQSGKPIPESCNMPALASQGKMGPKPDRDFQNAANQRDANLRYKTTPGSTDYWKRVNSAPSPGSGSRDDGLPKKGAYSSDKDARVMNGDNIDPKNGN